jgi:hypothetical protein
VLPTAFGVPRCVAARVPLPVRVGEWRDFGGAYEGCQGVVDTRLVADDLRDAKVTILLRSIVCVCAPVHDSPLIFHHSCMTYG